MTIVPYEWTHLVTIVPRPEQRIGAALLDEKNAREIGAAGPAYTVLDPGGLPLAIAGIVVRTPGRGTAWAVVSVAAIDHFRPIHAGVVRFLRLHPYRRLETMIDPRHPAAARWAMKLGFVREGTCRSYAPDGSDMELWAKVQD